MYHLDLGISVVCIYIYINMYVRGDLNSLCSVNIMTHRQASTRILNPYHTATACGRVTSQCLYQQDFALFSLMYSVKRNEWLRYNFDCQLHFA